MWKMPLAEQSHNPFPSAHGSELGFQETGLEYILRPEREGHPSPLTDRIAWKGAGPEELFVLFFLNPYDQSNASLKGGRGDFSRPLEREAKASPTQSTYQNRFRLRFVRFAIIRVICSHLIKSFFYDSLSTKSIVDQMQNCQLINANIRFRDSRGQECRGAPPWAPQRGGHREPPVRS